MRTGFFYKLIDSLIVFMDFVKCSKYKSIKSCCGEKSSMDDENESNELRNKDCTFPERKNKVEGVHSVANVEPLRFVKNGRYDENSKAPLSWSANRTNSVYQSSELPYVMQEQVNTENTQAEIFSSLNTQENKDFRCPRCSKRMQEPRLLPCLHPICSPCVSELMSRSFSDSMKNVGTQSFHSESEKSNYYELCPLCDFQLPNANSTIPPPHYPLQHRLVMNAVRSRFANKILCDVCVAEVVAVVQCSTCLRNFCLDCGMEHQQQITMELKPSKHKIRPLWEATKVRRTAFCQKHPTHALRFYCIACQQVTCKECMWSTQHRGHASENAIGAGKRVTLHLTRMLQRAKMVLNMVLTQYDRNAFSNGTLEEIRNATMSMDYRCFNEATSVGSKNWKCDTVVSHARQAQERIQEFNRLKRARQLLDAISLTNELLRDGSDVEILSLASTIVTRLKILGVFNILLENCSESTRTSTLKPSHTGIYHCCTFCSSGGKKEAICGCGGTMPGGYQGCGHGHIGHPGVHHWSCCGSILHYGHCLILQKYMHQLLF